MCDYDQPILLYMLFITIRFQLWSLIRTQLPISRCRRPVAIFYSFVFRSREAQVYKYRKRQEKEETKDAQSLLQRTFAHNKSLLGSWKIQSSKNMLSIVEGSRLNDALFLNQTFPYHSSSFLYYYPTFIIIIGATLSGVLRYTSSECFFYISLPSFLFPLLFVIHGILRR